MLRELDIRDFALIADLTFRPEPGFVVLTGETGAGKSILIGALAQLSGDRADTTMVRTGANEALLSAVVETADGEETILGRDVLASGRTVARIDGRIVTVGQLKEVGQTWIAIHGQREGQRIFDETTHRPLLDRFCREGLEAPHSAFETARQEWLSLRRELSAFGRDPEKRARRADLLTHQIREIEDAELKAGEEERLQETSRLNKTLAKVQGDLAGAIDLLGESEEKNALDLLNEIGDKLSVAAKASRTVAGLKDRVNEALAVLDGVQHELTRFFERIDLDPEALEATEKRLDVYGKLKYKYGPTIDDIFHFLDQSKKEYDTLINAESRIAEIEARLDVLEQELLTGSNELHKIRSEAAKKVADSIRQALLDLDMKNVRFEIEVEETDTKDWQNAAGGRDVVRFLIAPNIGEPLLPLAKIASGGEAARVLLAIKSILAEKDDVPILVFDEIDAGISGHTARLVGEKMRALGALHHVFCVTHSAAIAAAADHHYLIEKREVAARTNTSLEKLEGESRVKEIARLLSGKPDDKATLALAETMLAERRT